MAIAGLAARAIMFAAPNIPAATAAAGVLGVAENLAGLRRLYSNVRALAGRGDERMASEIVDRQRDRAPFLTGSLRDSIDYTRGHYAPDNPNVRGIGGGLEDDDQSIITIYAGDADAFYAAFIEYGTEKMDAHPFFWPAAKEVLDEWAVDMERLLDGAASEFNTEQ